MGEVKREGVRRFEMSVHPEPEVPYSVRPIPDEHGAFTYWGTWMDDHAKEIATLRAKVEEAYIYVVESECYCLPHAKIGDGMCERCVWLEGRD